MNPLHPTRPARLLRTGILSSAALCLMPLLAPRACRAVAAEPAPPPRLISVKPTALLERDGDRLLRTVEVTLDNPGPAIGARLDARIGPVEESRDLGSVEHGESTLRIALPDVREPAPAVFTLSSGGAPPHVHPIEWRPARHWTVYIVPITHHDLGYTDTIENVLNRYAGFYDDVLRFCAETQDWPNDARYRYTLESTWSLEHFLNNRTQPAIEQFAEHVRQGRIEIGALFGNEIDSLCGHEQQIRLLYPSFRFTRKHGGNITVGSITDLPGLSWGLASVLAGAGVEHFFAGLPTYFEWGRNDIHTFWDEAAVLRRGRPDAFRWEGPDGQSVLVYYQGSYGFFHRVVGPDSYDEVMAHLPGMLDALDDQDSPLDVVRYIHNGVDNYPPDIRISHVVREWNEKWAYPRLVVATNAMFFDALAKQCQDVRTFRGELPHTDYVVGAISTAKETTINRLTHDRLLAAEKAATLASLFCDAAYPGDQIAQAYDSMLLYDEHTWGKDYPAGEAQDWAWNEKSHYAYRAAGLAQSVLSQSLERIAAGIRTDAPQPHIVVFNPLAIDRTDVVRLTRWAPREPFDLIDDATGRSVAYQVLELDGPLAPLPYAAHRWARGQFEGHELFDLVFVAEAVPAMGYKTYRIAPRETPPEFQTSIRADANTIENRFYRIVVDPATGGIASIYDKTLARELVDTGAQHRLNQFVARWVQTGALEGPAPAEVRAGPGGPVCGSLLARGAGPGCPQLAQEVVLYDTIRRIDLSNRILKDSTPLLEFYFAFPFAIDEPRFRFEGSNSVIEPLRDQFPGSNSNYYAVQHWAAVAARDVEVTLAPVESHLLEFGGLWPCYVSQAHHGVTPPGFGAAFVTREQMHERGHVYAFVLDSNFRTNFQPVQQDDILFRYSLASGAAPQPNGAHRDLGWSAHNPLVPVLVEGGQAGRPLPRQASFCRVEPSNVFLLTLKQAEDGRGVIVRLIETEGRATTATLATPAFAIARATRTNLVEADEAVIPAEPHRVTAPVRPFGITTLRLEAALTPAG